MDRNLPGSSVRGILQARILEWVAISFSKGIFPTQESNTGLLHCRKILCQMSYEARVKRGTWRNWGKANLARMVRRILSAEDMNQMISKEKSPVGIPVPREGDEAWETKKSADHVCFSLRRIVSPRWILGRDWSDCDVLSHTPQCLSAQLTSVSKKLSMQLYGFLTGLGMRSWFHDFSCILFIFLIEV